MQQEKHIQSEHTYAITIKLDQNEAKQLEFIAETDMRPKSSELKFLIAQRYKQLQDKQHS